METVYMLQESFKLGIISLSLQSQCNAVYYCQISRSQKMLQLPLVASLEINAMALKIHDFGEPRRCKRWRQYTCYKSRSSQGLSHYPYRVSVMPFTVVKYLGHKNVTATIGCQPRNPCGGPREFEIHICAKVKWQRWDSNPRLRRDWCLKPAPQTTRPRYHTW